ncbi:MAG: universal stress protein [Nitrospirae bacterium]|nr:MAG: universal stress protein [Nitrospirota bacterium]
MKGYRKILIAMNGSRDVLTNGLKLAGDEKCWVTVVKVIPPHEGDLNLTGIKNLEDIFSSGSDQVVSAIYDTARQEGALIKGRVEEGEIDRKIVEVAEEERCDVIIMGSRKRSWLRTIFGDNVVEKVIQQAPCPVLVV